MIIIADSGATKTDWCVVTRNKEEKRFQSIGMNPYTTSRENITEALLTMLLPHIESNETVSEIHFYGAGCSSQEKKNFMKDTFRLFFPESVIHIQHDLIGACKALCGNKEGIVGILGTGSNSCLYNGNVILENIASLGYVLCDEGSGADIGKKLLTCYLRNEFPTELQEIFHRQFPGSENELLDCLYKNSFPNRFLASLSPFAYQNRQHPYIHSLLESIFTTFFKEQICKYANYTDYTLNLAGSVGYYFQDILSEIATKQGMRMGEILKAPLDNLIKYHISF